MVTIARTNVGWQELAAYSTTRPLPKNSGDNLGENKLLKNLWRINDQNPLQTLHTHADAPEETKTPGIADFASKVCETFNLCS